ncbi:cyclic nucleotide-binding domain-containing protein [Terasakiella sp. SH-1]|uniref:Crp/Fnr family transcriptional regulator n=1 Tax=Terasakiella sp. SH-1 TaxID=2560057 RepID=UPI001073F8A5|nr:cyclic nucleotide-binding domain-containing protein [Terasakiella sp. SH-1]
MKTDRLARLPILMRLPQASFEQVVGVGELRILKEGDSLCQQGQQVDGVIWLVDGRVKTSVSHNDGHEIVLDILTRGRVIGLAEVCDGGRQAFSAQAIAETMVFTVPKAAFTVFLDDDFDFQMAVFARVSAELRTAVKEINDLNLKNTSTRLGTYLLGFTDQEEGEVRFDVPFGKKLLAARLAMKPESLSRALAKLKPVGVTTKSTRVHIQDIGALQDFCGWEEGDGHES